MKGEYIMKKLIALVLAVLIFAGLCACGSGESVTFKSEHVCDVHGVYISPITEDEWGDSLNYAVIKKGGSITIDFKKFAGESPDYDVGVLDDTDMLYEFYEVPLAVGDTLTFSGVGSFGTLTVTGTDGAVKTYDGEGSKVETTTD